MLPVTAIIINYNTKDVLRECLENLRGMFDLLRVVVVDNGSSDGSAEMVSTEFNKVHLVRSENKGISAGANLATKYLSEKNLLTDYFMYLGTDAFPSRETVEGLIKYLDENSDVGLATAKLVLRDGSLDMDAHRGFPTPWAAFSYFSRFHLVSPKSKMLNSYYLGHEDLEKPHEIDACISHFMFIRVATLQKIGGWDEDYFVFGEDIDLCYRIKQSGHKIMYLPQFTALHYKGVSVGRKESKDIKTASNSDSKIKVRMKQESVRAMRLFYEKHYKNKYPWIVTSVVLLGIKVLSKLRI